MADEAEPRSLIGVVEPALPGMPEVEQNRAYELARQAVETSLGTVRTQLKGLRTKRDETNAEIKRLVAEEELLERMSRVRRAARPRGGTS